MSVHSIFLLQWRTLADEKWSTCQINKTISNSHLFTPYINTVPAKVINVAASFKIHKCCSFLPSEECYHSFGVYAWQTSRKNDTTRHMKISDDYKFAGNFKNNTAMATCPPYFKDFHNVTLKIGMKGYPGLYLAFEGNKACVRIDKVTAYYSACLQEYKDRLIRFQITPLPNSTMRVVRVRGFCTKNTVHAKDKGEIAMSCYANGTSNVTGMCQCAPGFRWIQSYKECVRKFFWRKRYSRISECLLDSQRTWLSRD